MDCVCARLSSWGQNRGLRVVSVSRCRPSGLSLPFFSPLSFLLGDWVLPWSSQQTHLHKIRQCVWCENYCLRFTKPLSPLTRVTGCPKERLQTVMRDWRSLRIRCKGHCVTSGDLAVVIVVVHGEIFIGPCAQARYVALERRLQSNGGFKVRNRPILIYTSEPLGEARIV